MNIQGLIERYEKFKASKKKLTSQWKKSAN